MGEDCNVVAKEVFEYPCTKVFEEYVGVGHSADFRNKMRADRQGSS